MQGFTAGARAQSTALTTVLRLLAAAGLALGSVAALAQGAGQTGPLAAPVAPVAPVAPTASPAPSFEELEARTPLIQRYPAGSIKSEAAAQQALKEAAQDRGALQTRYVLDQRTCYQKFLVNDCLEQARTRKRLTEKDIKQVEIEANTWRRQDQVDQRDQSLAEQHAKDQQDAARRLADQQKQQAAAARKVQDGKAKNAQVQQRIDQGQAPDARIRAHEAKVSQQQAEDAARAPQRAANAAKREQRIRDAEQHRLEVERKKAENERERAEKKRQQDAEKQKQQQQQQQQQQQAAPASR